MVVIFRNKQLKMIKKLLPFETLVYHSTLSREDLITRLENEIEAEKPFKFGVFNRSYSKPYIGKIQCNTFEIKRVIDYRNSFLPIIKGQIQTHTNGSKIDVKMNLVGIVKFFMIFWLAGVLLSCLVTIYDVVVKNGFDDESGFFMFIPFLMLIFGAVMVSVGFKVESKKSIKDLEQILKAKWIES
jgi:hypothetical protein